MTRNLSDIGYETYLLEYHPGTYGDFVSGLISYSIENFVDTYDFTMNDRYWTQDVGVDLIRNRYELSLRGNGYEFVENFSEHLLAHKIWILESSLLHERKYGNKILFNCHPCLVDDSYRTIKNNFTTTSTKFLLLEDNFDIMLKSTLNEYYTNSESKEGINNDIILSRFENRLISLRNAKRSIPKSKVLYIKDIDYITPDDISVYGNVNEKKFNEYFNEYKELKLNNLNDMYKKSVIEIQNNHGKLWYNLSKAYKNVR